MHNIYRRFEL